MFHKKILFCPVCDTTLGYLTKDEVCAFICQDCRFIYTWGIDGKLKPPVKLDEKKPNICDCASCKSRGKNLMGGNEE